MVTGKLNCCFFFVKIKFPSGGDRFGSNFFVIMCTFSKMPLNVRARNAAKVPDMSQRSGRCTDEYPVPRECMICKTKITANLAALSIVYCHSSSTQPRREIVPLDKWEILPEQIEYEEELGRGAFGVVYKAILKKRPGIEVFGTSKGLETKKVTQVVAVKELQGMFSRY